MIVENLQKETLLEDLVFLLIWSRWFGSLFYWFGQKFVGLNRNQQKSEPRLRDEVNRKIKLSSSEIWSCFMTFAYSIQTIVFMVAPKRNHGKYPFEVVYINLFFFPTTIHFLKYIKPILNNAIDVLCPMNDKESFCVGQKCNYSFLKFFCKKERSFTVVWLLTSAFCIFF